MLNLQKISFYVEESDKMFFTSEFFYCFCSFFKKIGWFLKRTNPATTTENHFGAPLLPHPPTYLDLCVVLNDVSCLVRSSDPLAYVLSYHSVVSQHFDNIVCLHVLHAYVSHSYAGDIGGNL